MSEGERLQKVLARAGYGSRRACEDLITSGRVKVNGEVPALGTRVDLSFDKVMVDKTPVVVRDENVYYLLHKPSDVVTTSSDPQKRKTVLSLVPKSPRVFSVGRLDMASEGLLILTNDGDFAYQLQHPSFGIEKEYFVELDSKPSDSDISKLKTGVVLDDGKTEPAKATRVGERGVRITIHEGRNRQIRRMCEALGYRVRRLVRTRIGDISDRSLAPGMWRELSPAEVQGLMRLAVKRPPRSQPKVKSTTNKANSTKKTGSVKRNSAKSTR